MIAKKAKRSKKQRGDAEKNQLLHNAAEEVQKNLVDNDEMSIREVCRVVAAEKNLNSDALRAAFRRSEKNEGKRHGNAILTDEEEKTIVGFILAFDMNSLPLTNKKICEVISVVFQQSVSKSWVSKFIYRHSKYLTRRIVKGLETRRVCDQTPEMIENWLESITSSCKSIIFRRMPG